MNFAIQRRTEAFPSASSWAGTIITDRQILNRVLGNMLKNALEATPAGGNVTLCIDSGNSITFGVNNPERVMPEEVQLRLGYSVPTGGCRGIGTYSMKLFGSGTGRPVDFVSRFSEGTSVSR